MPKAPATIQELGDDLAALMEHFDVTDATVIGISVPQAMTAMLKVLPDARYVEIPNCGHIPAIEHPDAFRA